jgi:hypothetical protein
MIPMDTDKALRQRFAPRTGDNHLYLLRDSTRDSDSHSHTPTEGRPSRPSNVVGSIQVVRPLHAPSTSVPKHDAWQGAMYDDGLSAARGILLGSALGLGFWSMVAGLIGTFTF